MSFVRPELAASLRPWREAVTWAAVLGAGLWMTWRGYSLLAPLTFVVGLALVATGIGLLPPALRRARLAREPLDEGVVVIDEWRIAYLGPRGGGVIDLQSVVRVEIVTRPHVPPASGHAWVLSAEDGTQLVVPLGAAGADRLFDALNPLPGIDFDAGAEAVAARRPGRAVVWRKAG
jgi:hypothetical protein